MPLSKIRIGIYIPNGKVPNVVLRDPQRGNPGVGGSQFLMFNLPYYMEKFCPDRFEFMLFAENSGAVESAHETVEVHSLLSAARVAKQRECDIFIFWPNHDRNTLELLASLPGLQLKTVAWLHTTPKLLLNALQDNEHVKRCICVGRNQYETLRDHGIFSKCAVIPNAVVVPPLTQAVPKKTKSVVFVGALVSVKGFHKIAQLWPEIVKLHPDADLYVIGSGNLYNHSLQMGSLGIADPAYEKKLRRYILDSNGEILPSIHFLGLLGSEKYDIIARACAGVGNHPGVRETFSLATAEILSCGTAVVSTPYGGLLDTVTHGVNGFLERHRSKIINRIDSLLSDPELSKCMGNAGRQSMAKNFTYEIHCKRWSSVLHDVVRDRKCDVIVDDYVASSGLNRVRERMRLMKEKSKLFNILPPSIYILHMAEYLRLKLDTL